MKRTVGILSAVALTFCAGLTLPCTLAAAQGASPAKAEAAADLLTIGSKAPELKVGKWVKNGEVKGFEKGKIYVVEFWATWCGPCKKSIPHLTEMAKQYKDKVTFAGISVWENDESHVDAVEKFVAKMGDKMDYHVAVDDKFGNEGSMAKSWMSAAQQDGIPSAFIVNGEGKIAWIGHPMQMEKPLAEVVAGKWDMAKAIGEAKKAAEQEAIDKENQKILATEGRALQEAFMGGDHPKVVTEVDAILAKHAALGKMLLPIKFMSQLKVDETAAYATGRALVASELKNEAQAMNQVAWTILDTKDLKKPDFALALDAAKAAAAASNNEDGMILDTLALATFKTGDAAKAIEIQTKAVELAKKAGDKDTLAEMETRLAEFKKGGK